MALKCKQCYGTGKAASPAARPGPLPACGACLGTGTGDPGADAPRPSTRGVSVVETHTLPAEVREPGGTAGLAFNPGDLRHSGRARALAEMAARRVDAHEAKALSEADARAFMQRLDPPPKDIPAPDRMVTRQDNGGPTVSDGGPSGYYDFPEGCNTLNDLIEYRKMSFAEGNIFKATFRLGVKDGAPTKYDLKKIIYYATRMLNEQQGVPYGYRDNPTR